MSLAPLNDNAWERSLGDVLTVVNPIESLLQLSKQEKIKKYVRKKIFLLNATQYYSLINILRFNIFEKNTMPCI